MLSAYLWHRTFIAGTLHYETLIFILWSFYWKGISVGCSLKYMQLNADVTFNQCSIFGVSFCLIEISSFLMAPFCMVGNSSPVLYDKTKYLNHSDSA